MNLKWSWLGNDYPKDIFMKTEMQQINDKLDFLTDQINSIMSRIQRFDDLKEDMTLFSNDAFNGIIKFLTDIDFHYRSGDFVFLIKKLLINVGNFSKIMDQLQSITELMEDVRPLTKEIFNDIIDKLNNLEKEGLFKYLESFKEIFKKFKENFTPEDIALMGNGSIRLLKLVSRFNKPGNIEKLEKIADIIEEADFKKEEKVSLFKLFKKIRKKEILQNAAFALNFISELSKKNNYSGG